MANYKGGFKTHADFAGVAAEIKSGDKVKMLYEFSTYSGTRSVHDAETGNAYQVPTGKKFLILYFNQTKQGGYYLTLTYSDAEDSNTGEQTIIGSGQGFWNMEGLPYYYEVPADHYINGKMSSSGAVTLQILGVETSA